MADVIYRFVNTPFGGNQDITMTIDEMPDYFPYGQEVHVNTMRASAGKIWQYVWYKKLTANIPFRSVGSAVLGTMGSLASENVEFVWYQDINFPFVPGLGTRICAFVGGEFTYTPLTPTLYDFDFEIEDRV